MAIGSNSSAFRPSIAFATLLARRVRRWPGIASVVALIMTSALHASYAVEFSCNAGDAACLIRAVTQANANGETNTILLGTGTYTLTTSAVPLLNVGLPPISSSLKIQGASATTTLIQGEANISTDNLFRLIEVEANGNLTLANLTLQGGIAPLLKGGGGVRSLGILTVVESIIKQNQAGLGGSCGGIESNGTLTIIRSTITENTSSERGGGICQFNAAALIAESSIVRNRGADGGGISSQGGSLIIQNTTIAQNTAHRDGGGADIDGNAAFINSTIAENSVEGGPPFPGGGGIIVGRNVDAGAVTLTNTILAGNHTLALQESSPDCRVFSPGTLISLGNNLFGDPTGCTVTLFSSDLIGDPGLAQFRDNGTPGNGHFPLRAKAQAVDAGSNAVCPRVDQLGRRRAGPCDIGAIRFRPAREVVRDLE